LPPDAQVCTDIACFLHENGAFWASHRAFQQRFVHGLRAHTHSFQINFALISLGFLAIRPEGLFCPEGMAPLQKTLEKENERRSQVVNLTKNAKP
jgi:hypothetical protein